MILVVDLKFNKSKYASNTYIGKSGRWAVWGNGGREDIFATRKEAQEHARALNFLGCE